MKRVYIRAIASTLGVLALVGCLDPSGPGGPRLSVALNLQGSMTPAPTLRADIGGRPVDVTATSSSENGTQVRGPRYGEVPVRVALLAAAGDTLADVAFSQQFRRDHTHWVVALVGRHRPVGHCIGALEVTPVRGAATDTMFVMYGSIPDGAIC